MKKKMIRLDDSILLTIHNAIHSKAEWVEIDGKQYPVKAGKLRYVDFGDTRVIEQNHKKPSVFADRARRGHKITWAMTNPQWIRIEDGVVYQNEKANYAAVEA